MKERENFFWGWGSCLRASTFKGASQCGAGEPQKPQEEYSGYRRHGYDYTPHLPGCAVLEGSELGKEPKTIGRGKAAK